MNKLIFLGRLGRDPELKYTPRGQALCSFSAASTRRWKSEDGEDKEETTWLEWTAWGRTAETIDKHFKKGGQILIEGRVKQDSWEDKTTGEKKSKVVGVVESFSFVGSKQEGTPADSAPTPPRRTAKPSESAPSDTSFDADDDVPF